ncbi:MAG: hypothetical protein ACI4WR_03215 [Bulleidia sp.]
MKKTAVWALCILLAGCAEKNTSTSIANPWTDDATLEQMVSATGISLEVPSSIQGNDLVSYRYMEGLDEADYEGEITIRKGTGSEDVSGDYNEYPVSRETDGILLKGMTEGIYEDAVWSADGYSYSITVNPGTENGFSEEVILEIVNKVK